MKKKSIEILSCSVGRKPVVKESTYIIELLVVMENEVTKNI